MPLLPLTSLSPPSTRLISSSRTRIIPLISPMPSSRQSRAPPSSRAPPPLRRRPRLHTLRGGISEQFYYLCQRRRFYRLRRHYHHSWYFRRTQRQRLYPDLHSRPRLHTLRSGVSKY